MNGTAVSVGKLAEILFRKGDFVAVKRDDDHVFFFRIFFGIKNGHDFADIAVKHIVFRLVDKLQYFIARPVDNISEFQLPPFSLGGFMMS